MAALSSESETPPKRRKVAECPAPGAYRIRVFQPGSSDTSNLYSVCLRTGASGSDASGIFQDDPEALGRRWVGPYLTLAPELALVLERESDGLALGYALGCRNTTAFTSELLTDYLPDLQSQFPCPSAEARETWTPL